MIGSKHYTFVFSWKGGVLFLLMVSKRAELFSVHFISIVGRSVDKPGEEITPLLEIK